MTTTTEVSQAHSNELSIDQIRERISQLCQKLRDLNFISEVSQGDFQRKIAESIELLEKLLDDEWKLTSLDLRTGLESLTKAHGTQELRIAGIEESVKQLGARSLPGWVASDIFEGNVYGTEVQGLIQRAWKYVNNPTQYICPIRQKWLTPDQRNIRPHHFDVLAAVYMMNNVASQLAYAKSIADLTGAKTSDVTKAGTQLMSWNYLQGSLMTKGKWNSPGPLPYVYGLTDRGMRLFLPLGAGSAGGSTHAALELLWFRKNLEETPERGYFTIQVPGKERCDGLFLGRDGSTEWKWYDLTAVQYETPQEVEKRSSIERDKEGQVFRNMIIRFAYGVKHLEVVCVAKSEPKLTSLKDALPSWLSERIRIFVAL